MLLELLGGEDAHESGQWHGKELLDARFLWLSLLDQRLDVHSSGNHPDSGVSLKLLLLLCLSTVGECVLVDLGSGQGKPEPTLDLLSLRGRLVRYVSLTSSWQDATLEEHLVSKNRGDKKQCGVASRHASRDLQHKSRVNHLYRCSRTSRRGGVSIKKDRASVEVVGERVTRSFRCTRKKKRGEEEEEEKKKTSFRKGGKGFHLFDCRI